jgi:hypothetical protein
MYSGFCILSPSLAITAFENIDPLCRKINSFNTWRAFAANYGDVSERGLFFHVSEIDKPYQSFSDYLSGAMPASNEWITYVTICNLQVSGSEMAFLGRFPNLGTVEFIRSVYPVTDVVNGAFDPDDAIIRSWSRAARSEAAFPRLRALKMRNQPKVTGFCLPWLCGFPALYVFGCNRDNVTQDQISTASSFGWQLAKPMKTFEERYQRSNPHPDRELPRQQRHFVGAGMLRRDIIQGLDEEITADDQKPVHEFRIGYRADFRHDPAPNSVIFERVKWFNSPEEQDPSSDGARMKRKTVILFGDPGRAKRPRVEKRAPTVKASKQKNVGDLLDSVGGL